ncbi:MgtC/SapB family protein [Truepera radiovictrix]|uniref:MgtC/SapB transporter n=1 Tax=Truepera radiovictrix (strain DSM 17093 / CIP 108686 / LMG 22925 / RQ-24) TaxID=649638 RepID=D7CU87_TRURR|nr:MgtC/SapB family protein [Truepera radiovictrix]ADI13985.1 MgtC/SapB transporter [Truepera radiovictrix DSM 17093]WMT57454.1 MgtC/SapB family protein [Truepera radiovictrix]
MTPFDLSATLGAAFAHPYAQFFLKLLLALALGATIGLERQWRQRMAGLRTNALVSVGAASFVSLPLFIDGDASPTRVAAQVVSGIGFLGAGVIIRDGASVRGLNTAATLWGAAAVGVLAGSGFVIPALMAALVVLLANVLLRPLARRIDRQPLSDSEVETGYTIEIVSVAPQEAHVRALLLQMLSGSPLRIRNLRSRDVENTEQVRVRARLVTQGRADAVLEQLVGRLSLEPSVTEVSWEVASG